MSSGKMQLFLSNFSAVAIPVSVISPSKTASRGENSPKSKIAR